MNPTDAITQSLRPGTLSLVDTTLREGEQFAFANFTSAQRIELAQMLDRFGVDILELPSPLVSPGTESDVRTIAAMGLQARVVSHVRCVPGDVAAAIATGVQGVHLFFGTSPQLQAYSHGRGHADIIAAAITCIQMARDAGLYVRFSAEDAFRTEVTMLETIFDPIIANGVDCIGMPDTIGIASPRLVTERVAHFRQRYPRIGIEFHGHNDIGCATANALAAIESGATHCDVTVLGIGERNGITSLSGCMAGVMAHWPHLATKYNLQQLPVLDAQLSQMLAMPIPFNLPITSPTAFTHKAGIHTNAVLHSPDAYEVLNPAHFGVQRTIDASSRLTGYHAIIERGRALGILLDAAQAQTLTHQIKSQADIHAFTQAEIDSMILGI